MHDNYQFQFVILHFRIMSSYSGLHDALAKPKPRTVNVSRFEVVLGHLLP